MTTIDFYFDFHSPYSYLAHCRLPDIARRHGAELVYHPIDLKAAKLAAGNTAPPTVAIPPKLKYAMADFARWCARYGVPLTFSQAGPPEPAAPNTATFLAIDRGQAADYVTAMWEATFGQGGRVGDEAVLRAVASRLGWDADETVAYSTSEEGARRYAAENAAAQQRGVFGAPIIMVGDEMWWGNDRLDFVDEYLSGKGA
ncbi:MAG TPA: 2-hydroxychromene-2-carboxylate isomerase [Novosphingobium sp.]|nr:2-hydroxychromene-2-carboxylate isomerase [Novosphingobium sp.]